MNLCRLCGSPVGKNEYLHSRTPRHLTILKKSVAKIKKKSDEEYNSFVPPRSEKPFKTADIWKYIYSDSEL